MKRGKSVIISCFYFSRPETMIPDGAEECVLQDIDPLQDGRRKEHGNAYDEDEPGSAASRVQCATS